MSSPLNARNNGPAFNNSFRSAAPAFINRAPQCKSGSRRTMALGPLQSTGSKKDSGLWILFSSLWHFTVRQPVSNSVAHKLRPEPSDAISSPFLKTRYCGGIITGLYAVLNSQTIGYTFTQRHEITLHSEHARLDNRALHVQRTCNAAAQKPHCKSLPVVPTLSVCLSVLLSGWHKMEQQCNVRLARTMS